VSDTTGIVMANLSLTIALAAKLKEKGIITEPEMAEMMDNALLGLEQMSPDEEGRTVTHAVLTQLRDILCQSPPATPG